MEENDMEVRKQILIQGSLINRKSSVRHRKHDTIKWW